MTSATFAWSEVLHRLDGERTYWLSTVGAGAIPHVCPVWGVTVESAWYFYTEQSSVKARNLASNPHATLNLGDGEDVLIVRGRMRDVGHPVDHPDVVTAFSAKYTSPNDREFLPLADPAFDVVYVLDPSLAMTWRLTDYAGSQRRWRPQPNPARQPVRTGRTPTDRR